MVIETRRLKVGTIPFVANSTQKLDIPRNNAIRRISFKAFVEHVAGGSNPTEIQDTILKILKKLRLVIDGDDNKFNLDGQKMFYLEKYQKGTEPATNKDAAQGASSTLEWYVQLDADFAQNRLDLTDVSALLPAKKFSQLVAEIEWGDVDDMFSANTGTITAANSGVEIEITEAIDTENNDGFARGTKQAFSDIRETISEETISKVFTNLEEDALNHDIKPVPSLIMQQLILVKDSAGLKVDANVSDFAIVDVRGSGKTMQRGEFESWKRDQKAELQLESLDDGVLLLDYVEFLRGGLGNVFNEGDMKLKFKTAVGSGTVEILTRFVSRAA